ncbi:hypothetical protein [Dechloromonas sp. ZS-1]|uniref:hypothetical protein n=1 Tax=Dechloromonas sp. ZS-1 TaxID=3138067 RepID=UPI0031FCB321
MRLFEFASAEEQLALWKLVSGSVWSAISLQAKEEAEQQAIKQQAAKLKKGGKGKQQRVAPKPYQAKPLPTPKQAKPIQQPKPTPSSTQIPQKNTVGIAPNPTQTNGAQAQINTPNPYRRQA